MGTLIGIIIAAIVFGAVFSVLLVYNALSWGFVTFKFWTWFVLPVFVTLPALTFLQAVGLWVFITLFQNQTMPTVKKEYRDETANTIMPIVAPWLVFAIGFLIKRFIVG